MLEDLRNSVWVELRGLAYTSPWVLSTSNLPEGDRGPGDHER